MAKTISKNNLYLSDWLDPLIRSRIQVKGLANKVNVLATVTGSADLAKQESCLENVLENNLRSEVGNDGSEIEPIFAIEDKKINVIPYETGRGHYILIIIDRTCSPALIVFQDSLGNGLETYNALKIQLSEWFMIFYPDENFQEQLIDLRVKQQLNGYDCGPLLCRNAVDVAVELVREDVSNHNLKAALTIQAPGNLTEIRRQDVSDLQQIGIDVLFEANHQTYSKEKLSGNKLINDELDVLLNNTVEDYFSKLNQQRNLLTDKGVAEKFNEAFENAIKQSQTVKTSSNKQDAVNFVKTYWEEKFTELDKLSNPNSKACAEEARTSTESFNKYRRAIK